MSSQTKHIFVALALGAGVFVLWEMYKAWKAGAAAIGDIILAPWNAAKAVWTKVSGAAAAAGSTVANNYSWASQLPSLTATELQDAQNQNSIAASYQPGGATYNMILATQGQAAADAAAATAARNAATEQQQANADASSWETRLFSWL